MPGALGAALTTHTIARRAGNNDRALDSAPKDPKRYIWEDLLPRKVKARVEDTMSARDQRELDKLKNVTIDQAVNKFVGRVKAGENISTQWPEMSNFLRAHPEATHEIASRLRHGG